VGGAVAIVEGHQLVREVLWREGGRGRRDDEGSAHDHAAPSDLERANSAFRHPAVIAALSGLEHLRFAARLELPLIGGGLRGCAFRGGLYLVGRERGDPEIQ